MNDTVATDTTTASVSSPADSGSSGGTSTATLGGSSGSLETGRENTSEGSASTASESVTLDLDSYRDKFFAELTGEKLPDADDGPVSSEQEQSETAQDQQGQLDPEPAKDNSKQEEPQNAWFAENLPEKFKSADGKPNTEGLLKSYLNLERERPQLLQQVAAMTNQLRQVSEMQRFQQATSRGFDGLSPEQQQAYEERSAARNYTRSAEDLYWDDVESQKRELTAELAREQEAKTAANSALNQYVYSQPEPIRDHVLGELGKLVEQAPEFASALWGGMSAQSAQRFYTRIVDAFKAESELAKERADRSKIIQLAKEEALREARVIRTSKQASTSAARPAPVPAAPNRTKPDSGSESEIDRLYRATQESYGL